MTIEIDRPRSPSVFDAGLPVIDYEHAQHPDEAHSIIRQARKQAPIAIGPHGPELLTYELVHAVLRDPRFRVPEGMFLEAQGITSGPLWDRIGQSVYGFLAPGTGGVNSDGKAQGFYVKFEADENAPVPGATVRNSGNSFAGHLSVSEPFQGTSSGAVPPNNGGGGHTTGFFGDCSGRGCG